MVRRVMMATPAPLMMSAAQCLRGGSNDPCVESAARLGRVAGEGCKFEMSTMGKAVRPLVLEPPLPSWRLRGRPKHQDRMSGSGPENLLGGPCV